MSISLNAPPSSIYLLDTISRELSCEMKNYLGIINSFPTYSFDNGHSVECRICFILCLLFIATSMDELYDEINSFITMFHST